MKAFRIGINDPLVATAQIRKALNYRVNGWDGRTPFWKISEVKNLVDTSFQKNGTNVYSTKKV